MGQSLERPSPIRLGLKLLLVVFRRGRANDSGESTRGRVRSPDANCFCETPKVRAGLALTRETRALPPCIYVAPLASPLLQEAKMPVIPNLLRFSRFLV